MVYSSFFKANDRRCTIPLLCSYATGSSHLMHRVLSAAQYHCDWSDRAVSYLDCSIFRVTIWIVAYRIMEQARRTIMRFRLLLLALGTFAIGTDGFVIAGILPSIAHDLSVSITLAGFLVTAFSLAYALGSPVLAALTGSVARRRLLLLTLSVFILANVLAAVATSFLLLLIVRMVAALSAALYTPSALTVAAALAPKEKRGQALSLITAGLTIATVAGVPLGILISTQLSWRTTFLLVALLGVIAFIGILALFPSIANPPAVSLHQKLAPLRQPAIVITFVNLMIWVIGAFTVYTYLSSLLEHFTHLQGASISVMFLLFGGAGVIGNMIGGYGADHWGAVRTMVFGLLGLAAAL